MENQKSNSKEHNNKTIYRNKHKLLSHKKQEETKNYINYLNSKNKDPIKLWNDEHDLNEVSIKCRYDEIDRTRTNEQNELEIGSKLKMFGVYPLLDDDLREYQSKIQNHNCESLIKRNKKIGKIITESDIIKKLNSINQTEKTSCIFRDIKNKQIINDEILKKKLNLQKQINKQKLDALIHNYNDEFKNGVVIDVSDYLNVPSYPTLPKIKCRTIRIPKKNNKKIYCSPKNKKFVVDFNIKDVSGILKNSIRNSISKRSVQNTIKNLGYLSETEAGQVKSKIRKKNEKDIQFERKLIDDFNNLVNGNTKPHNEDIDNSNNKEENKVEDYDSKNNKLISCDSEI